MKRTTIFLPDDLHERLREEAFRSRISVAELIRSRLSNGRPMFNVDDDPLLAVAGICNVPGLSDRIDEHIYDLPPEKPVRRRRRMKS
jgi:hypothetical protein